MTIRIDEGDWTRNAFGGVGSFLEFGKEYKVNGIYKDYVCGEMLFVGDGEYAIPVFVSDDGMVSALNIYYCAPAGYFSLTEPVMNLTGIEAITETTGARIAENVGMIIPSQGVDFAKRALGIYGIEGYQEIYDGDEGTYGYYIGFDENSFRYQQFLSGLSFSGECVFLGVNEDGLVFSARITADDADGSYANNRYSAFSLKRCSKWDDEIGDIISWANFRYLGGCEFFDEQNELKKLEVTNG